MDINVTFENGKWITDPQFAIVMRGTKVRWIFRAPTLEVESLRWQVKFHRRKPFEGREDNLAVNTRNTYFGSRRGEQFYNYFTAIEQLGYGEELLVNHRGMTPLISADEPGDYKYDLRVADAKTERSLGDEDPWLFVVSPIFAAGHLFLPK
jgi:hypothetical protein